MSSTTSNQDMTKKPHLPTNDNNLDESFVRTLVEDVSAALRRHDRERTEQHRRELIRSAFAAIDGYAWLYRTHVVQAAKTLGKLEPSEEVALSEMGYAVSATGKVSEQPRFLAFLPAFRLTTRIASRVWPEFTVSFDGSDWQLFANAVAIRNRITHPKRSSDLTLDSQDVATCMGALFWLLEVCTTGMEAANHALRDYNSRLRDIFVQLREGNPQMLSLYEEAQRSLE